MSLPNGSKPEEVTEMDFLRPDSDRRTRFQVNRVRTESYRAQQERPKERENAEKKCKMDSEGEEEDFDLHSFTDRTRLNSEHAKSFRQLTREVLPRLDNYRNIMSIQAVNRPTLDELHNATLPSKREELTADESGTINTDGQIKFGWIQGVLIRCLLNIWGVMLFLRLTWVVAQAGIGQSILLILTTTVVTSITSLSMSAISTNGVIKGGGTYYMISRSLGPEFGGSIGLIFSLANAVACAMYVVGFGESLVSFFPFELVSGFTNNVRIIGCITIIVLLVVVVIGMEWEAKAQFGLLVILLAAILDYFIGSFIPPSEGKKAKGFVGFNASVAYQNLFPDYREFDGISYDFFKVFAVFFPAATGILAGANISGDLKDPQTAIPKGTILAILITTLSYVLMAVFAGCTVMRDASGVLVVLNTTDFSNVTNLDNVTDLINSTNFVYPAGPENMTGIKSLSISDTIASCIKGECKYGLHNNFQVVELVSWFGPIIYAGCFAATLSSALASLVSAPKVFQALCKDKLYPGIEWFAKGYGPNNEPIRGYILTFIIAVAFILIGELNLIAPLISNFFLAAYTLINFSTFHASLAKPVGWRPTFKYYNMWLSLVGAILCVLVMFLISWWTALLTFATILALYLIVAYRKPNVNWGSTTQAQIYKSALQAMYQLNTVEEHVKNYRPQILVLSGMPSARPTLVHFAHLLTKNLSMLVCGHVNTSPLPQRVRSVLNYKANSWLKAHKLKAFYMQVDSLSFEEGAKALLKACGIGKLRPNIILMGHKSDWQTCLHEELLQYFEILHNAFDLHLGVGILRMQQGFEIITPMNEEIKSKDEEYIPRNKSFSQLSDVSSNSDLDMTERVCSSPMISPKSNKKSKSATESVEYAESKKAKSGTESVGADISFEGPQIKFNHIFQQRRQGKRGGTIDVWWLYDDGGLTLLLPYIISTRKSWSNHKLRVFALANKRDELELEHRNMASLLAKFRIDYSDLQVVPDVTTKPMEQTQKLFDSLISNFKVAEEDKTNPVTVSESELMAVQDKTNRHLRLRELLLQHSSEADMVVLTLPIPRKNIVSAPLYFAWLEVLTKDMPPILLVRGNQTSVLTFYS